MLFLQKSFSLGITSKYMIKDSDIVSLCLLFDLQNVNVLWEVLDLLSADSVDQSGFSNTVAAD